VGNILAVIVVLLFLVAIIELMFDINAFLFLLFDRIGKKAKSISIMRFAYRAFYLHTSHWREFSKWICHKRRYTCERCHKKKKRHELNVHHLSYVNLMKESEYDVKLLCIQCHREEHINRLIDG